jgi:dihydrofolate reductase
MPKVVFSSTTSAVEWNARLVTGNAVEEITRLKAEDGGPMDVGGATLAAAAIRAGLIDEYAIVTHPVLVGGGTPLFTALDNRVNLSLVETRTFPGRAPDQVRDQALNTRPRSGDEPRSLAVWLSASESLVLAQQLDVLRNPLSAPLGILGVV